MSLLGGEASQEHFKAYDSNGLSADAKEAIFPIIKQNIHTNQFSLVGTGFFISPTGLLMTAKHVLQDVISNHKAVEPIGILHFLSNDEYKIRSITRGFWSKHSDVAVAQLDQPVHKETKAILHNKLLKLSTSKSLINDIVFTFAYPASEFSMEGSSQKLVFCPSFYEGKLIKYFPRGRDRTMLPNPCWQTNIYIHGGASGGPVFNSKGAVIGINSTSLNIAPDCSHISTIEHALSLEISGLKINGNAQTKFSLRELGKLRIISIDRS